MNNNIIWLMLGVTASAFTSGLCGMMKWSNVKIVVVIGYFVLDL